MRKSRFLIASSLAAIAAAGNAYAQDTAVEQVVVSASRISIAGYEQPTPVTMVGVDVLDREAKVSLGDSIRQLPSVGNSSSPTNGASAGNISASTVGLDTVNLRNLGTVRTLVLFDGQRVVQSNITGVTDLATIPTALVQRIDIVTGGASAAWGSDAVSGVVNVVINKNFEGLKGSAQVGTNYNYELPNYRYEAAYGTGFAGGKGHVIVSGRYTATPNVMYPRTTDWYDGQIALINNPAVTSTNPASSTNPQFLHAKVGLSQATNGGLITANPRGTGATPLAANALAGIQFVGPNGTPTKFNAGTVSGALATGPDAQTYYADVSGLTVNQHATTLFGYASYELTPTIKASMQLNYGKSFTANASIPATKFANLTIRSDNAFLDPGIAAQMAAGGVTSFTMGSLSTNNYTQFNSPSLSTLAQTFGIPVNNTTRQLMRGVFTLEGTLGSDWSWNSYYQHGNSRIKVQVLNNVINQNYNYAVDAVRVTQANVGASGLPIGSIQCRALLSPSTAAAAAGCQPLNLFGDGVVSAAAAKYVTFNGNYQIININQDVLAGSMQGKLPWGLPAGQVAVAFGAEYRKEGGRIVTDPGAAARAYPVGNFVPFAGQYNVQEGFLEVTAPLLRDTIVQNLDFNAAGRITSYSTSGMVETWKLGLTSQVNDDIRLRTIYSVDIRAPNLNELFSLGVLTSNTAIDPRTNASVSVFNNSRGNPNLTPEVANTVSGGIVLTPTFAEGLSVSLDWYSITIHKAIFTANAATVLQQCTAGVTLYCSQLVYGGPNGALSEIMLQPLNAASEATSGLDFQIDYAAPLFEGDLRLRLLGNYTNEQTRDALGRQFNSSNCLGSQCNLTGGQPKFKTMFSATYAEGPYSFTAQTRLIGSGRINTAWTSVNIDSNDVPFMAYLDLRAAYDLNDHLQFFGAMDNVANEAPPIIPSTNGNAQNSYYFAPVRGDIYDTNGRTYRIGVRFNY